MGFLLSLTSPLDRDHVTAAHFESNYSPEASSAFDSYGFFCCSPFIRPPTAPTDYDHLSGYRTIAIGHSDCRPICTCSPSYEGYEVLSMQGHNSIEM